MNLPNEINQKLEEKYASSNTKKLKEAANRISNIYVEEFSNGGSISSKEDILAYAITRMPATFSSISSALEYVLEFIEGDITSVLDLGSGTGSSLLACSFLLKNHPFLTAVEKEKEMIELSKYLLEEYDSKEYLNLDMVNEYPTDKKSDLVIASYSLNELNKEQRTKTLDNIWLSANKYILIVEPGTPNASKEIKEIRQYFIDKGGYVIAPCPHCNKCMIEESDWCHFSSRVQRSKLHKLIKQVDSPFEDEKYSYIAISKMPCNRCSSRVMRHPIETNGKVTLTVCDNTGVHKQDILKKEKDLYKKAKKITNGDSF